MPYAENCSRKRSQRVSGEVCSCQCKRQTAVLHCNFNSDRCFLSVGYLHQTRHAQAQSHTNAVVQDNSQHYDQTAAHQLSSVDSNDTVDNGYNRYNGNQRQNTAQLDDGFVEKAV